jgi:hypothetical protein
MRRNGVTESCSVFSFSIPSPSCNTSVFIFFTMGRGMAWTEEEERHLCKAYIKVSSDSSVGTDLSGDMFMGKVNKLLNIDMKRTDTDGRTVRSTGSRFSHIKREVGKFMGAFKKVNQHISYIFRVTCEYIWICTCMMILNRKADTSKCKRIRMGIWIVRTWTDGAWI